MQKSSLSPFSVKNIITADAKERIDWLQRPMTSRQKNKETLNKAFNQTRNKPGLVFALVCFAGG